MNIRRVKVEFLRAGPPHNQLLSPLTQYLAICGESGAGVVTAPYEHATFLRRLTDLRYGDGDSEQRRLDVLQQTAVDMARLLGSVPGFEGSLTGDPKTLVHLRLVLSASELALLPFELSKMPHGREYPGDNWLALQTQVALCITRHIRSVPSDQVKWCNKPRILFVAGDPEDIPFQRHVDALQAAIGPWERKDRADQTMLRVVENATIDQVEQACRETAYTHIHVLTHGAALPNNPDKYGIVLGDEVIPGDRFATAISSLRDGGVHRPTVVTVASCDSGQVGSVIMPGASFAHDLHQSGIPLVVASQFPLSQPGSVVMADTFYRHSLMAENPLITLHKMRTELHSLYSGDSHDWASVVAYEALPPDLDYQLQVFRYKQSRRSVDAKLSIMDDSLRGGSRLDERVFAQLIAAVKEARDRLPVDGPYAAECLGLRGSIAKRLAQAEFQTAIVQGTTEAEAEKRLLRCYQYLEQSADLYSQASRHILVNLGEQVHRIATLHWVVVQKVSIEVALGKALSDDYWKMGKVSAELYLNHPEAEERAWAHGSVAELLLLALARPDYDASRRAGLAEEARYHVRQILEIYPDRQRFPVASTWRQFQRYWDWWGDKEFDKLRRRFVAQEQADWEGPDGIIKTAMDLGELLESRGPADEERAPGAGPAVVTRTPAVERAGEVEETPAEPVAFLMPANKKGAYFSIEMLPARNGDCLWIEFGDKKHPHRMLIDCGVQQAHSALHDRVVQLPEAQRRFELLVLSHIDSDHIGGAIPFLKSCKRDMLKEVWFNGWKQIQSFFLGAKQGEIFSTLLEDGGFPWNPEAKGKAVVIDGSSLPAWNVAGMKLTLLSPTAKALEALGRVWKQELQKQGLVPGATARYREFLRRAPTTSTDVDKLADAKFVADDGRPNGSSIAFLAEFEGKSALLAADAHAPVLVKSVCKLLKERNLKKLRIDALKVPHHGSAKNLNIDLLELLDCPRYLISTNGSGHHHPDREAIARVIKYGKDGENGSTLYFNYYSEDNEVWSGKDLQATYGYSAVYPKPDEEGLKVDL